MKNKSPTRSRPWWVDTEKAEDGTPFISVMSTFEDGTENVVCRMGISDGQMWGGYVGEEEDARLIAAAPDLLAACEAMRKALESLDAHYATRLDGDENRALDQGSAAIARARGEA